MGGGAPFSLLSSPAGALGGGGGGGDAAVGVAASSDAAAAATQQQQRLINRVFRYGGAGGGGITPSGALPPPSPSSSVAAASRVGAGGLVASGSWDSVQAPRSLSAGSFTLGSAAGLAPGVGGATRTSSRLRVFQDLEARAEQHAQH